jgi:hypothetical protein
MNHKRGKRKNARSGCLMCKPNKMNGWKKGINSYGHHGFSKIRKLYFADKELSEI